MARSHPEVTWYELHVPAPLSARDMIVAFLAEAGTAGCQELEDTVVAYFQGAAPRRVARALRHMMERLGHKVPSESLRIRKVATKDWAETWKAFLGPVQVSSRVLICPTWASVPSPAGGLVIHLDPGMAFGSGHHATTRGMLLLLEECVAPGQRVLDVGTGSGILAIAACKLGSGPVFACDTDREAVFIARENARRNHVDGQMHLWVGSIDACRNIVFDLIAANITTPALLPLLPEFKFLLRHQGALLLSGILDREEQSFAQALAVEGFKVTKRLQIEEWVSLVMRPAL